MNNYNIETLEGLKRTVSSLQYHDHSEEIEKLALKCIQKSQFFKDVDLEFTSRYVYVQNAFFLNKDSAALAMFPWLLKKCDEDRSRFNYRSTLWAYKWIIGNVKDFARIPLEKIDELFADMERRFKDFGTGDKVIHYFKIQYYNSIGELKKAEEQYDLYCKSSTNYLLDDCKACQPNNLIDHMVIQEKYSEALRVAQPILEGQLTCVVVPETTYPKLIFPSIYLNEYEAAENYAILAKKKLKVNQANLPEAAELIKYYSLKKDWVKGRNLIQKQLPFTRNGSAEIPKFYFYLGVNIFILKMIESKKKTLKISIPKELSIFNETEDYSLQDLQSFFGSELEQIINALNNRNRNNFYTELKERTLKRISEIRLVD